LDDLFWRLISSVLLQTREREKSATTKGMASQLSPSTDEEEADLYREKVVKIQWDNDFRVHLWKEFLSYSNTVQVKLLKSLEAIPYGPSTHPDAKVEMQVLIEEGESIFRAHNIDMENRLNAMHTVVPNMHLSCMKTRQEAKRLVLTFLMGILDDSLSMGTDLVL
jgi:hypothetical protein